jgi:hypothetical protein
MMSVSIGIAGRAAEPVRRDQQAILEQPAGHARALGGRRRDERARTGRLPLNVPYSDRADSHIHTPRIVPITSSEMSQNPLSRSHRPHGFRSYSLVQSVTGAMNPIQLKNPPISPP